MTNYSKITLAQSELEIILDFERNLEQIFSTDIKVVICPPSDGLVNLAIEVDCSLSLPEIISLIRMPFDDSDQKVNISKPILQFQNALYGLNQALTPTFDFEEVSIYFKNTSITIYSVEQNSIVEEFEYIVQALLHHYEYYSTIMGQAPNEIHIPVLEDTTTKKLFTKNNSVRPQKYDSPYSKYWGLYFDSLDKPLIYNLSKTNITPGDLYFCFD